jgi:ketosteroid isomerase-like protein
VFGTIRAIVTPSGRRYEARFALHLTVQDGRMIRHHVYEDSLAVKRAWAG